MVAVAQVDISDAEYAIIYSGIDITLRRLRDGGYAFPNLELKVRTFIRKCPLCQLTSQIKPLVKVKRFTTAALYPFQVKDEEGYQYTLVVICALSRWIELYRLRPQPQKILHAVFISTSVDEEPPIDSELIMAQLSLTIS